MRRRTLLGLGSGLLGLGIIGGWTVARGTSQPLLLSARDDAQGRHYAVGYELDGTQRFSTRINERCHDAYAHPYLPIAVFTGRRPSRESYVVDLNTGELLQTLHSPEHRHFYGHGVFDKDGQLFYTTENNTRDPGRGVLGVYQVHERKLDRIAERSTHGIGPHQLLWMPDGEHLVVANGGIRTEADSREMMNLNAMDASLVIMHHNGTFISPDTPPQQQNSIRHLAVARDGTVVSGQQYEGDAHDKADLVAIKRPGQAFAPFPLADAQRDLMQQYTASVAIHDELRLLAITAPRGNRFFVWDLDTGHLRLDANVPDGAGVGAYAEGFVVTSGQGRCRLYDCTGSTPQMQALALPSGLWDNHLRLV